MLRAMDSAVAGLRAHQNKLDVIGHNIANVNTYGYKSQSYTFKEAMYQTSSHSTAGTDNAGGTNAAQYGYGTLMGTITMDMTASTPTYVGGFNASINGEGFFITLPTLEDGLDPENLKATDIDYTRVGMFSIDSNGYMVDSTGNFVYGYQADADAEGGVNTDQLVALRAPINATANKVTADKTTSTGLIYCTYTDAGSGKTETIYKKVDPNTGDETYYEDKDGTTQITEVDFEQPDGTINTVNATLFDEVEEVESVTYTVEFGDGEALQLSEISINTLGEVTATIKSETNPDINGVVISLGKVAIATFQNPEGMTKKGDIYYGATTGDNSGLCSASVPGGTTASLMTGYVEASNVDLAKEFSDLITTQRGFQANTKIVTVSDQILEELVNMKR